MVIPACILCYITGDLELAQKYPDWADTDFLIQFILSSVMGYVF